MSRWKRWLGCGICVAGFLTTCSAGEKVHVQGGKMKGKLPFSLCERALRIGKTTSVALHLAVGADGRIKQFDLLKPKNNALRTDNEFTKAVNEIRFEPTYLNGKAVEIETTMTVTCDLYR